MVAEKVPDRPVLVSSFQVIAMGQPPATPPF